MSKHTPGPWHVVLSDNATPFIQHEQGYDWTDINDRSSHVCHMPAEITKSFNSLNNARLIAAAPDLLEALEALLERDQRNTCQHEETHRGGAIWEICDFCGMKWSDDRNPKPEWSDPEEWIKASAAIAKAKGEPNADG